MIGASGNKMKHVGLVLLVSCLGLVAPVPASAQDLGEEADQAFWCAAAYAGFVNKGVFVSPDQQATALADLAHFESAMAAEAGRLGWTQTDVENLSLSYYAEVEPQLDDYLQWRDPAALRLRLDVCFPSVVF
jgi:hypothetical protein